MKRSKKFNRAAVCAVAAVAVAGGIYEAGSGALSNESNSPQPPAAGQSAIQTLPAPIIRVHSHNDYEQKHPLWDALDSGFTSVEADIYLVNGQLLVGHTPNELSPDRTLESLYLKPLMALVRQNNGHVYPQSGQNVQLLIDIKTDGNPTYQALDALLQKYKGMFTSFSGSDAHPSAITAVISGNRPDISLIEEQPVRYAALDGKLSEMGKGYPLSVMPLISDDWATQFKWDGNGEMPAQEREKLQNFVKAAHANGQKIRFWDAPDNAGAWKELLAAGADYINTDHLPELRAWRLQNDKPSTAVASVESQPGSKPAIH